MKPFSVSTFQYLQFYCDSPHQEKTLKQQWIKIIIFKKTFVKYKNAKKCHETQIKIPIPDACLGVTAPKGQAPPILFWIFWPYARLWHHPASSQPSQLLGPPGQRMPHMTKALSRVAKKGAQWRNMDTSDFIWVPQTVAHRKREQDEQGGNPSPVRPK